VRRSIWLIANPAAGGGKGGRLLPTVRRAFDGVGVRQTLVTSAPGDERVCVRRALEGGADTIAILGGDGTWSKATAAIVAAGAGEQCRVALLAGGTGNDFVASVGAPARAWVTMARMAAEGPDRRLDCARVDGRHVLNVGGMGFDAAVIESLHGRTFGGALRYRLAALQQIFRYRPITCDPGDGDGPRPLLLLAVANGRRFGGGLVIAPHADPGDGLLELIAIEDAKPLRRLELFRAVMRARHIGMHEVTSRRVHHATIHFPSPPLFQTDGELHQATSASIEVECVPGALRVVTPRVSSPASPSSGAASARSASRDGSRSPSRRVDATSP
jgi:YegS/Rv2252/BmrU family lipid kinase